MSPLGRHIFIAQGGMRAKPEMKPWVSTDSEMSSFRSGTNSASIGGLAWGSAAPTGLKNVYQYLTQGLRPGLCRSAVPTALIIRDHCHNNAASAVLCNGLKFWYASSKLLQGSMDSSFVSL